MLGDLEEDVWHPIPNLDVIDVLLPMKGGAGYGITIARPLGADRRSLIRLKRKIETYVDAFYSSDSPANRGVPIEGRMWIYVYLHKDSHARVLEELKLLEPQILAKGISLVVKSIDDNGQVVGKLLPASSN